MLSAEDATKNYFGPNFDCLRSEIESRIIQSGGLITNPWDSSLQLVNVEDVIVNENPEITTMFYPDDWDSIYACAEEVAIQGLILEQRK